MNRQQWKERLPLIEAYVNGETIQFRPLINDGWRGAGEWMDSGELAFDFDKYDYRIKPKPREYWINVYPYGVMYVHESEKYADLIADRDRGKRIDCIHVREVVE